MSEESETGWKRNRIFTGNNPQYPVELFIYLLEEEGCIYGYSSTQLASNAWCLIDSCDSPAGDWKSEQEVYLNWEPLKADLLATFSRVESYSQKEVWSLFTSLSRGREESNETFMLRIQWFLGLIKNQPKMWLKLLFVWGLDATNRNVVFNHLNDKSVPELCKILNDVKPFRSDENKDSVKTKEGESGVISTPSKKWLTLKNNTCLICGLNFETKTEFLEHHVQTHQGKCEICNELFSDKNNLEMHRRTKHNGREINCKKCGKGLRIRQLETHDCQVDAKKRVVRSFLHLSQYELKAGETPSSVRPLTTHLTRIIDSKKSFICGYCSEEFPTAAAIRKHTTENHDGNKYRCDLCADYVNPKLPKVAKHRLAVHNVETPMFPPIKCNYQGCSFWTVTKKEIPEHVKRVHEKVLSHKCGICDKAYPTASKLQVHVEQVHMKLKTCGCDICGEKFMWPHQVKKHKRESHGNKTDFTYVCHFCAAQYYDARALDLHMERKHMQRELSECKYCHKKFVKECLKNHIKTYHEKDDRYSCPKCNKTFPSGYSQRLHIKTVHLNFRPFKCGICNNVFTRPFGLAVHIGTHHEGMSPKEARKSSSKLCRHSAFVRAVKGSLAQLDLNDVKEI